MGAGVERMEATCTMCCMTDGSLLRRMGEPQVCATLFFFFI